jgi:hypothetical protein
MVDEKDRPFALRTNLYSCLERLPVRGLDPEAERARLVDLRDEEIQDSPTLVDPGTGRVEGGSPVGDRKGYASCHRFSTHHQPQDLREIPVLRTAEEWQVHGPHGEAVDIYVDAGRALDHLLPGASRPWIAAGGTFAGHRRSMLAAKPLFVPV